MDTTRISATIRRLDNRYEHLMMTTRWVPFVVVAVWFMVIGAIVKVLTP